ncbi:efflux transporter SaoE [Kaarinaea lacus]
MTSMWQAFSATVWQVMWESAFWVVLSLVFAGLIHEFLPTSRLRGLLNRRGQGGMLGSIVLGACLPMCSCGVIPLAISLYRSGVKVGPVMAFAAATPIINPAAVILSLALLGPQLTLIYVVMGLLLPFLMGVLSQRLGDSPTQTLAGIMVVEETTQTANNGRQSLGQRLGIAFRWGFTNLGPTIAFYLGIGVILAGLISALLPTSWIDTYLHDNSTLALLAAAVLGASVYVCAVAHIPFVAALLASGVAPGIAIVYLAAGTATNLPELIALYKTIGRRTVIIYTSTLIVGAIFTGVIVNSLLLPDFVPALDPIRSLDLMTLGENLQFTVSGSLSLLSVAILLWLAGWGTYRKIREWLPIQEASTAHDCCDHECR